MSKSMKGIDALDKVQVVEQYLSGEISSSAAIQKVGVNKSTFCMWVRLYRTSGPTALLPLKKNQCYSKEFKLKIVREYLDGSISQNALCEKYNIRSHYQIQQWLQVYNNHGTFKSGNGGSYMKKARNTNYEERLTIVKDCLINDRNYAAMALKYKVSYQQVRNWVKKYDEMGAKGLEDRRGRRSGTQPSRTPEEELRDRIAQLEREKEDLQMENDILKKVKELERRNRYL